MLTDQQTLRIHREGDEALAFTLVETVGFRTRREIGARIVVPNYKFKIAKFPALQMSTLIEYLQKALAREKDAQGY